MLTLESLNLDKPLSVFLAIGFAEKAFPAWEAKYLEDMRPRKAIEAAKEWLSNPSEETAADAANAAHSAYAAAAADSYAARSAYAAARAADYAAAAAAAVAAVAACAARAAAVAAAANAAAAACAAALNADKKSLIHEVILENLDWILKYKIENGQSFAEPELILNCLDEGQKQSFLFNLDKVA